MRIFVAGATGAVGKRLVPLLVERGDEVAGMTPSRPEVVQELGATAVKADALDRRAVERAVVDAQPEVVVLELTALSGAMNLRRFDRSFAQTNRLRTEGTDNLLAATRAAGARRLVAQSYGGWPYAREGGPVKTEDDPLDPRPARSMSDTLDAIKRLEHTVPGAGDME